MEGVSDQHMTSGDCRTVLFSAGIIADVQYADRDNKYNYQHTRLRYYRSAITQLEKAVAAWKAWPGSVDFVLQLGDLIDGVNKRINASEQALQATLTTLSKLEKPIYHVWGNHELYNFTRTKLLGSPLNSAILAGVEAQDASEMACYHFSPYKQFRIVVLDMYEISTLGYSDNIQNKNYIQGCQILDDNNHNSDQNSTIGLYGLDARYSKYNGGMSDKQLKWLENVLNKSDENKENVIMIGHCGLHPESIDLSCLAWNSPEMLSVIYQHNCVMAYICGHNHDPDYAVDDHGIHHVTMPGAIEAKPDSQCFAVLQANKAGLVFTCPYQWNGFPGSLHIPLKYILT